VLKSISGRTLRSLREYFTGKGTVKRAGAHGKLLYNAVHVRHCAENYDPVMDHIKTMDKASAFDC